MSLLPCCVVTSAETKIIYVMCMRLHMWIYHQLTEACADLSTISASSKATFLCKKPVVSHTLAKRPIEYRPFFYKEVGLEETLCTTLSSYS